MHNIKVIAYGLLIALILFALVAFSSDGVCSQSTRQLIVDKNGSSEYSTIQSAVDSANSGDFILVKSGEYTEDIAITTDNLKIYGFNAVLGGSFTIASNNVLLTGFTVNGNSESTGIILLDANDCYVSNNTVSNLAVGILTNQTTPSENSYARNYIVGNQLQNNEYAIKSVFYYSNPPKTVSGNYILANNIADNIHAIGVEWNIEGAEANGENITFSKNTITNNVFNNNEETLVLIGNINTVNTVNSASLIFTADINNNNFLSRVIITAQFSIQTWTLDDFTGKSITFGLVNVGTIPSLNTFDGSTWGYVTAYWDDGNAGNYWSDYQGTDSNNDHIGDSAYTVSTNNIDRYPLMAMASQESIPLIPSWGMLPNTQMSSTNAGAPDYFMIITVIVSVVVVASVAALMLRRKFR